MRQIFVLRIDDHTVDAPRTDIHQSVAELVHRRLAEGELYALLHRRIHQRLQFD